MAVRYVVSVVGDRRPSSMRSSSFSIHRSMRSLILSVGLSSPYCVTFARSRSFVSRRCSAAPLVLADAVTSRVRPSWSRKYADARQETTLPSASFLSARDRTLPHVPIGRCGLLISALHSPTARGSSTAGRAGDRAKRDQCDRMRYVAQQRAASWLRGAADPSQTGIYRPL